MWIYDALYQECNKTLWLPCKLEFSPPSRLASIISDGQKIAEMKEFNAMYLVPGVPFSFAKLKVMLANEEGHSSPSNAPHLIGAPPNSVKCKSNLNSQSSISQNSKNTNGIIGKNLLNNRYQIMYTVDKQKKTKIWHDGTAEYKPISEEWIFLDQDNKNIHRRKTSPTLESVEEGLIIDSARFLIEVGAPILGKSKRSSNVDDTEPVDVQSSTEMDPDLHLKPKKEVEEIKFPFLYTTQKTQKAKKWKDGVVNWNTSTLTAVFNDEDRRPIHRYVHFPSLTFFDISRDPVYASSKKSNLNCNLNLGTMNLQSISLFINITSCNLNQLTNDNTSNRFLSNQLDHLKDFIIF